MRQSNAVVDGPVWPAERRETETNVKLSRRDTPRNLMLMIVDIKQALKSVKHGDSCARATAIARLREIARYHADEGSTELVQYLTAENDDVELKAESSFSTQFRVFLLREQAQHPHCRTVGLYNVQLKEYTTRREFQLQQ